MRARTWVLVCAIGVACGRAEVSGAMDGAGGTGPEAGADGARVGDSGACFDDGPGCEPWCPGQLLDAGLPALNDFPFAQTCAGSDVRGVVESTLACQGFILVSVGVGVDSGGWWLFDATTGECVAVGSAGAGTTPPACMAAVPGLRFPYQCFLYGGWAESKNMCPEGGIAGDAGDAAD